MASVKLLNGDLARLLIEWRLKKGLKTVKEAAWFLGTSEEILSSLESGTKQFMDAFSVAGILAEYGAPQHVIDDAKARARQIRYGDPQRWQESGPAWFKKLTDLEVLASTIDIFEDVYVTGLCQTIAYARAIMDAFGMLDEDETNTALDFRAHRRTTILEPAEGGPKIRIIQSEHALTMIEGTELYADQLARLAIDSARPNVELYILPTGILHPSMDGPYVVLGFDDPKTPDRIYVENLLGADSQASAEAVKRGREVFSATLALAVPYEDWRGSRC